MVNTFFFDQYTKDTKNPTKIMRILSKKPIDVKQLEKLFVPMNFKNSHWSFIIFDLAKGKATYCDSLSNPTIPFQKDITTLAKMLQKQRGNATNDFAR